MSSLTRARVVNDVGEALPPAVWSLEDLTEDTWAEADLETIEVADEDDELEEAEPEEEEVPEPVIEIIGIPEEEHEAAVTDAYENGFEAGRQAGEEAEAARLRNALQIAEATLDELRESEVRWSGAIEENICGLAVAVARQVIGGELAGDPERVVELVRKAVAEFPVDQPIRIRVNPRDLATIEGITSSSDPKGLIQNTEARWIADTRVAPGGCLVEGRERIVDGRIDTALERIYRRLTYTHV